ncbi:MAG: hypothetical protein ACREQO_03300 [Candidatus Binatia bacterium]
MIRERTSDETLREVEFYAAGLLVKVEGAWTGGALAQFRHFLDLRGLAISADQLRDVLQRSQEQYFAAENHLYLCAAQPCCSKMAFDTSDNELTAVSRDAGLPISKTGCQGPCKQAPLLSLRIGARHQAFAQVCGEKDWRTVLAFVKAAVHAGSLLVDTGNVEEFRYDPVHDHAKPSAHLKPLRFLLGHFRGEGRYAMSSYSFHKEVIGTFEAGGRFIALRMDASYPLADGHKDVHKALVIVGLESASGNITAHAYTDGGIVREYAIERTEQALEFADLPPGHSEQWKRARKILSPTQDGFEERLDVDAGAGFIPYYTIPMQRLS